MLRRGNRRLAVLALGIATQLGFAQDKQRCVLAGSVFNSATNAAIPHALVSFFGGASGYRFTDSGGNFQVADVPCQTYTLQVSKPGYVSEEENSASFARLFNFGGLTPSEGDSSDEGPTPPQPSQVIITLQSDSPAARILLNPVASISGTVLDENGEPLTGVSVQGIAIKQSLAGADYAPAGSVHTDDRGQFALLNLTPGDYLVRLAGEVSSTAYFSGSTLNLNNDHRGLRPVYYPNADSPPAATVMHLAPGEHRSADFHQPTEPAFDVNGRLAGFVPQAWTQMRLYREGDKLPVGRAFVNTSTGLFRVIDVPPGNYKLLAVQYQADPPKWFSVEEALHVASEPIQNLVLELSGGVEIPVSVSYEAGASTDGFVQLMLMPQHTRSAVQHLMLGNVPRFSGQPEPDSPQTAAQANPLAAQPRSFTDVIPDTYRLHILAPGIGTNYVSSAKLGEVDVLHGEFAVGSAGGALHLTIRGDCATVQGQVNSKDKPAEGAAVYLVPTSGDMTGMKVGVSDPEGHYQVLGVPPGDYRILALIGAPSLKDLVGVSGDTLTLQPNEKRTMTLEAVEKAQQP